MNKPLLLDANVLGKIVYPKKNKDIALRFTNLLEKEIEFIIPEISDYEVRRGLLHKDISKAVERLNELKEALTYLPITTDVMLKAAELWAMARKQGKPTSDPKELDCDIILTAQTLQVNGIVITENIKHFIFVETKKLDEIIK
ncbi:MAG: PIN domain-containing protein [Candidatus Eremiobacterota bacterium]